MIDEVIKNGTYPKTDDTIMQDLKRFHENFKKYEHCNEMYPESNEPAKIYGKTKTHKFDI